VSDGPGFGVELPVFSGPFRALAELILDHKVDVCDVPVASVTDRFLSRAQEATRWDLEEATWFLAICAVLLELKVRRLMPRPEELRDEDLLSGSPDLAYARSLELAAFRRVAVELARMFEDGAGYHNREAGPPQEFAHLYPDVMEKVTPEQLAETAAAALRSPPAVDLSHVAPIRASVSDAIRHVERLLDDLGATRFRGPRQEPLRDVRNRDVAHVDLVVEDQLGQRAERPAVHRQLHREVIAHPRLTASPHGPLKAA